MTAEINKRTFEGLRNGTSFVAFIEKRKQFP